MDALNYILAIEIGGGYTIGSLLTVEFLSCDGSSRRW